jgi:hypothetical protein
MFHEGAVSAEHQRNEVLGPKGAKRGLRFPKWQVTSDGGLLSELPRLFDLLGRGLLDGLSVPDWAPNSEFWNLPFFLRQGFLLGVSNR